jgi:hypothetical protein
MPHGRRIPGGADARAAAARRRTTLGEERAQRSSAASNSGGETSPLQQHLICGPVRPSFPPFRAKHPHGGRVNSSPHEKFRVAAGASRRRSRWPADPSIIGCWLGRLASSASGVAPTFANRGHDIFRPLLRSSTSAVRPENAAEAGLQHPHFSFLRQASAAPEPFGVYSRRPGAWG